jgi:hypothetical protein
MVQIAAVNGLGTKVVESNDQPIIIDIDRSTQQIMFILNQDLAGYMQRISNQYRQTEFDYFDLKSKTIRTKESDSIGIYYIDLPVGGYEMPFRIPFKDNTEIMRIVKAVKRLSNNNPCEIEGCILNDTLYLYQKRGLEIPVYPDMNISTGKISLIDPIQVIGFGKKKCDLYWLDRYPTLEREKIYSTIRAIDENYKKKQYAFLTTIHNSKIISMTPNVSVRMSSGMENMISHAAGSIRIRVLKGEDIMLLGGCGFNNLKRYSEPIGNYIYLIKDAIIESNGKTAIVYKE